MVTPNTPSMVKSTLEVRIARSNTVLPLATFWQKNWVLAVTEIGYGGFTIRFLDAHHPNGSL